MNIGKEKQDKTKMDCKDVEIDHWELEKEEDDANNTVLKDVYKGKMKIDSVEEYEYLGNILCHDGSHSKTIQDRIRKSHGIIKDILQVLNGIFLGNYYISALILMRNSMINSVLTYNLEVIPNLSQKNVKDLEKVDLQLLRKATLVSSKSARILLLSEMGLLLVE